MNVKKESEKLFKKMMKDQSYLDKTDKIIEQKERVLSKLTGALEKYADIVKDMLSLVKDYAFGSCPEFFSKKTVTIVAATILYILNPVDLVSDFIPVVGLLDDTLIVELCLGMVSNDLKKYHEWKAEQAGK